MSHNGCCYGLVSSLLFQLDFKMLCNMEWWICLMFGLLIQRLKNWEIRERKKSRDYEKETEREEERRREMVSVTY